MTFDAGPRHEKLPWNTPTWARYLVQLCQEILQKQETIMATEADLSSAIDQLTSVVDTVVAELQTALSNNASSGSIPADHIQALLDKVTGERDKVNAALAATPTNPAPGAPAGGTAPAPGSLQADPTVTGPTAGA